MTNEQVMGMLNLQYGVEDARLVHEYDGVKYFEGIDAAFKDAIEVRVRHVDAALGYRVATRIKIEGYDVDYENEELTDIYFDRGRLMEPIKVAYIG